MSRHTITWKSLLLGGAVALLLYGALGCSGWLFRARREGPPALPPEPQKSVEHVEAVRALADWSARMWRKVWSEGAASGAPAVGQAADAAGAVTADLGAPAKPLPVPPPQDFMAVPEVPRVLDDLAGERADHAARLAKFQEQMAAYRSETVRKTWSFGIPALAPWLGLGLSGLVIFWLLRLVLKWKTALWQVFLGVKGALATQEPTAAELLKTCLSKAMDTEAKALVKQLYAKVGE